MVEAACIDPVGGKPSFSFSILSEHIMPHGMLAVEVWTPQTVQLLLVRVQPTIDLSVREKPCWNIDPQEPVFAGGI